MNKLLLLVTFIIRVGSGIVMLMQGYEKLTGGFTLKGLVPVIANNTDYILADMIFTYPLQLTFFILLLMSHSLLKQISLKEIINYFRGRKNRGEKIDDPLTDRG